MANYRKDYKTLKREAEEQDARLPLTDEERKQDKKAELVRNITILNGLAVSQARNIRDMWAEHVRSMSVVRQFPLVHAAEVQYRNLLAQIAAAQQELGKL